MTRSKRPNGAGYIALGYAGHQINGVRKFDHVRIAEAILGRPLPPEVVVHHANEIRDDNRNENLVICPNKAYHNLLHARMNAMKACGNPNWRRCRHCKQYDAVENLRVYPTAVSTAYWHMQCARDTAMARYWMNKGKQHAALC